MGGHTFQLIRVTTNYRLIIPLQRDPELPDTHSGRGTYSKAIVVTAVMLSFAVVVSIPSLVLGFFAFGKDVYDRGEFVALSGSLELLAATISPEQKDLSRGGGDIEVVGDALLAQSGPSGTLADIEGTEQSDRISVYVVREGDTLSQIAGMFSVSVNTIRWANDIGASGTITPGEKLIILPISGVQHVVKNGDTIKSIASKYDGDVEEILNYNGIASSADLVVGKVVTVPHGEIAVPASPTNSGSSRPVVSGGPTYAGYYMRPIHGGYKSQGAHGYNGVDLATYAGAEIYAAAAGEVIIVRNGGWNGGYGNYVVIRHDNGTQTLYAHNSSNIVSVGQRVVQGQVIGYVGSTGRSTGAHVHFEVRGATNPF